MKIEIVLLAFTFAHKCTLSLASESVLGPVAVYAPSQSLLYTSSVYRFNFKNLLHGKIQFIKELISAGALYIFHSIQVLYNPPFFRRHVSWS